MPTIYTAGHSTRTLDELVGMLKSHGVAGVADVRRFAGSRRLPHFNAENLAIELPKRGLAYLPCPLLGGRRKPQADSTNTGWRNASFRAYADYMQTPDFAEGLQQLMGRAGETPLAMMCAEAVPWRCHRSLIADALIARGWTVIDVMSPTQASPHKLTPFARVDGPRVTYPGETDDSRDEGTLFDGRNEDERQDGKAAKSAKVRRQGGSKELLPVAAWHFSWRPGTIATNPSGPRAAAGRGGLAREGHAWRDESAARARRSPPSSKTTASAGDATRRAAG
jgi:hypothetical protein